MKNRTNLFKGIGIALLVYILGMIIFYFKSASSESFFDFFLRPGSQKMLLPVLTAASIPNIGLFAWFIQKNKLLLARGILTTIIFVLVLLAYIKFVL